MASLQSEIENLEDIQYIVREVADASATAKVPANVDGMTFAPGSVWFVVTDVDTEAKTVTTEG